MLEDDEGLEVTVTGTRLGIDGTQKLWTKQNKIKQTNKQTNKQKQKQECSFLNGRGNNYLLDQVCHK